MVRGRRNSQVCCHCFHRQNYYKSHHHFLPSLSNSSWMACSNLHCHLSTQCHHHHPSSLPSPMVNHSPSIITTITNGEAPIITIITIILIIFPASGQDVHRCGSRLCLQLAPLPPRLPRVLPFPPGPLPCGPVLAHCCATFLGHLGIEI